MNELGQIPDLSCPECKARSYVMEMMPLWSFRKDDPPVEKCTVRLRCTHGHDWEMNWEGTREQMDAFLSKVTALGIWK